MHNYTLGATGVVKRGAEMSLYCSTERPWGVHSTVRNDEDCPRCGWTAPGPRGDAVSDAAATVAGAAIAQARFWTARPLAA